ncbi:hypothetical protein Srubr_33800 [Streptomyces rubradiris]|uniref:PemK-like, MazF-like toxin of type II toxin-antitoxin system n=1 Tax=Streptomyces rubradiris TaxID=285531 RepID=A0ABQ3RCF6_STRRR|nr:hypothetical protein GCM10018792_02730 [Streptomyces rubradiris]GHI53534.1 hypothetical protein Srubr_33800 [Streptomyces rubradiris]
MRRRRDTRGDGANRAARQGARVSTFTDESAPGRHGPYATTEADPREVGRVRTEYSPAHDGDPDPGEIGWTWVPYEENDGRGKDRPVPVVAREAAGAFLALPLSSKRHDGDREWVAIGGGPWDRFRPRLLGGRRPGATAARAGHAQGGLRAGPDALPSGPAATA